MYMQVPVELHEMKQKLEHLMTTSLDMLFEKNILKIPRSAIKTTGTVFCFFFKNGSSSDNL